MIKKTIVLPNKKLRMISQEVKLPLSEKDDQIAKNLEFYLKMAENKNNDLRPGAGIAAVQLGFLKRMFLVKLTHQEKEECTLLINPKIESYSVFFATISDGEGCLSVKQNIPNQKGFVHRRNKIVISGYSYFDKKYVKIIKTGLLAIVYQHEMDHLDGKLFIDHIDKENPWIKKDNEEII